MNTKIELIAYVEVYLRLKTDRPLRDSANLFEQRYCLAPDTVKNEVTVDFVI